MWGTPTGMADIFISYARHDREQVEALARVLEKAGFSVWWDRDIAVGETFSKTIEKELNAANAVVVAWSEYGNASEWVKDEASLARDQNKLFPILLDGASAPLGFQQFQSADFSAWNGEEAAAEIQTLIAALHKNTAPRAPAAAPQSEASFQKKTAAPRNSKNMLIAAGVGAVIAISAVILLITRSTNDGAVPVVESQTSTPAASEDGAVQPEEYASLAVLPFVNMSSDPEQEFFADGLSEELLNWLANVRGLKVPGRTSSFQYKGKLDDLRRIGEELNVQYLLEGSVRRSGDQLRITAQLIEAENGYHLWSETYDRNIADIFAIQDEIARVVVTELLGVLPSSGVDNPAAVGNVDPEAHEHYLAGRALWSKRRGGNSLVEFEKAITIDPGHALAQAYYAIVAAYGLGNSLQFANEPGLRDKMNRALEKAVELSPASADVVFAQGWVQDLAYRPINEIGSTAPDRIASYYRRAVRLNPRHVEALHALARSQAEASQSAILLEQVLAIDEGIQSARVNLAISYLRMGEDEKGFAVIDRTFVIAPSTPTTIAASLAKSHGNVPRMGDYLFRERSVESAFPQFDRLMRAQTLADMGALEEAIFITNTIENSSGGDELFEFYSLILVEAYLPLIQRIESLKANTGEEHQRYFWLLTNSLIKTGQAQKALDLALDQNPQLLADYRLQRSHTDSLAIPDEVAFAGALALEALGRNDDARQLWQEMLSQNSLTKHPYIRWEHPLSVAILNAKLGETENAVAALQEAYDAGFRFLYSFNCEIPCINHDLVAPDGYFASLQGDPEFERIMDAIKEDNARSLESFERRYGVLSEIREQITATNSAE